MFSQKKESLKKQQQKQKPKEKINTKMLIYACKNKENFLDVIQNGLKCTKSDKFEDNYLGPSDQGVHLCKSFELSLLNEYLKNSQVVYFVLVDVSHSISH